MNEQPETSERQALFDYFSGCANHDAPMIERLRVALGLSTEKPRWQTFTVSRSEGTELGLGSYEGADRKFELVYWQKFMTANEARPIVAQMEAVCAALNAAGVVV